MDGMGRGQQDKGSIVEAGGHDGRRRPRILLLAGPPFSGKSSIAAAFVAAAGPGRARHLSVGDLKRSIVSGETPSRYRDLLQVKRHPERASGAAPSEAILGIIREFMEAQPAALTVMDGFPRYEDRLGPFQELLDETRAQVIGLAIVEVSRPELESRGRDRPARKLQELGGDKDVAPRLDDHDLRIKPTLAILAQSHPTWALDGTASPQENAQRLMGLCGL
jgi:adenylate kinase family enzyme